MLEMAILDSNFQNFLVGGMPQTPLEISRFMRSLVPPLKTLYSPLVINKTLSISKQEKLLFDAKSKSHMTFVNVLNI